MDVRDQARPGAGEARRGYLDGCPLVRNVVESSQLRACLQARTSTRRDSRDTFNVVGVRVRAVPRREHYIRPDKLERRFRARLDALGRARSAELLHVLMLPTSSASSGSAQRSLDDDFGHLTCVRERWSILARITNHRSRKETGMPLFMDHHAKVEGLTAQAVGEAHRKDLETQGQYGVNYIKYWFDEDSGQVWCLVEAPDADSAMTVHREAHGLLADDLTEVQEGA